MIAKQCRVRFKRSSERSERELLYITRSFLSITNAGFNLYILSSKVLNYIIVWSTFKVCYMICLKNFILNLFAHLSILCVGASIHGTRLLAPFCLVNRICPYIWALYLMILVNSASKWSKSSLEERIQDKFLRENT